MGGSVQQGDQIVPPTASLPQPRSRFTGLVVVLVVVVVVFLFNAVEPSLFINIHERNVSGRHIGSVGSRRAVIAGMMFLRVVP